MKPTRTFTVCTAPIICGDSEKFDMIEPPLLHEIRAVEVKHIAAPGEGWFHLIDAQGSTVFSSPTALVRWCKVDSSAPVAMLSIVPPISEEVSDDV